MPRKGLNIYKRKDGRWEGRYVKERTPTGKLRYGYIYDQSYGEVRKQLLSTEAEMASGKKEDASKDTVFNHILDLWLQSEHPRTKESTFSCYYRHVQNHIRPILGPLALADLNAFQIEQFTCYLLREGRADGEGGLAPKTVSDILSIVKEAIEYAQYMGYLIHCPTSHLSPKQHDKEMRVLSIEEQRCLEKVLLSDIDRSKFGVLISLYTGLRIGELCALKWNCIDVQHDVLWVRKTLQRIQAIQCSETKTKVVITEPKSDCSNRCIPLPAYISRIARNFVAAPEAFVLTGNEEIFLEPRTLQYRFSRYIKQSGIASANYHSLRHTFATRCVESGFDVKTLSEILGHSSVSITLNRYVHTRLVSGWLCSGEKCRWVADE